MKSGGKFGHESVPGGCARWADVGHGALAWPQQSCRGERGWVPAPAGLRLAGRSEGDL